MAAYRTTEHASAAPSGRNAKRDVSDRQRSIHGSDNRRGSGRYDRGLGRQVQVCVLPIRNGDIDGNAATEREASWQPIDNTPMHPEYPCAHCIVSSAVASAVEAMLGTADIPEVTMTSPMAPGVTHRWTNLHAYADEVSAARIAAGFHYRFSTVVGEDMGRQIGTHAVKTIMQPLRSTSAR